MNLKEAFRYQNKLQAMMIEAEGILGRDQNITKIQNTHLRSKVMPEAEDETTVDMPSTEYSDQITSVAEFLLFLLGEREKLGIAIYRAKATLDLPAGLDGETGLNSKRQEVANLFRHMAGLRGSEALIATNASSNSLSFRSTSAVSFAWWGSYQHLRIVPFSSSVSSLVKFFPISHLLSVFPSF